MAELDTLRLMWPVPVVSDMSDLQFELERQHRAFVGFVHLAQLWHCPVPWCTQWKGTPQDCVAHLRPKHTRCLIL